MAAFSVWLLYGLLILESLCKSHCYQLHKDNQALILQQYLIIFKLNLFYDQWLDLDDQIECFLGFK